MNNLQYSNLLNQFPAFPEYNIQQEINHFIRNNQIKIVILDDDPTGIQTVHSCFFITQWDEKTLTETFEDSVPFFYILTNSRSLAPNDAENINREIIRNVIAVNQSYNFKLIFISRSDSTLRGHFPLEPAAIRSELKKNGLESLLPTYFVPSFLEAGRFTLNDIQYIKDGDNLIPVGETEFARDNVFGYSSSYLPHYIIEKTFNDELIRFIRSVSINELRGLNTEQLVNHLKKLNNAVFLIINALDYYDLYKFSLSFLQLFIKMNTVAVLRTSSSLPKALSGIESKTFLTKKELNITNGQGLFVIGSHVSKTTRQLELLLKLDTIEGIEIDAVKILEEPQQLFNTIIERLKKIVTSAKTPVIYTSRTEIRLENTNQRLELGNKISTFLVEIIKNLPFTPAYLVAKGGITSNDVLTKGLNVKKARVTGQILAGIPIITTDTYSTYPNLPYIIFPGNVGDENALAFVYNLLKS